MGIGGSMPGVMRPGREADHSPPTGNEVKKMWIHISTPSYAFIASASLAKHRDDFTVLFARYGRNGPYDHGHSTQFRREKSRKGSKFPAVFFISPENC
jgi:hypothetical protein